MISFTLNGRKVSVDARDAGTLSDLLKYELAVNSIKIGCESGECGACAVLLDGKPIPSCLLLAQKVEGRRVDTLEGLGGDSIMQMLEKSFAEANAMQCGFCTPGMLISLYSLFKENMGPSDDQVAATLEGNLCRCGAYLEARKAATNVREGRTAGLNNHVEFDAHRNLHNQSLA